MSTAARLLWMLAAAAAPCVSTAQSTESDAGTVVLQPGDSIQITVWRKPDYTGRFAITADGSIAHPLYRAVRVGGLALPAAEARLQEFLARYEASPQFVIEPLFRVAVGGEVQRPNLYSVGPGTTIAQAISLAGGPTERGRRDRVRVRRETGEVMLDLRRGGDNAARTLVRSGDQIMVERQRAVFREIVTPVLTVLGAAAAIVTAVLNSRDD